MLPLPFQDSLVPPACLLALPWLPSQFTMLPYVRACLCKARGSSIGDLVGAQKDLGNGVVDLQRLCQTLAQGSVMDAQGAMGRVRRKARGTKQGKKVGGGV